MELQFKGKTKMKCQNIISQRRWCVIRKMI